MKYNGERTPVILLVCFMFLLTEIKGQTGTPTGSDPTCPNGISLYHKLYGGTRDEIAEGLASSADSGYIMAGSTNSFGNGLLDGWVSKVDKKGVTVWSKAVGGSNNENLYGIKRTSDNGFIAVGQTKSYGNAAGDGWLVKLDAAGNVQWSRKYGNGNASGDVAFDVVQLSDGGYAFSGAHQFAAGVTESFVVRTDNLGNVIWSKQYGHSASDEAWGLTEDGNSLIVVGFHSTGSFYDGYLMKLDKTTGVVQWIRRYDAENRSTFFAKVRVTSTGYQVFSLITDDYTDVNQQLGVWNINADGTVQNVRKMVIPGIKTINYGWYPYADGGFMIVTGENNPGSDMVFTRVNNTGGIIWSKKYAINGKQLIRAVMPSPEGGYVAAGANNRVGETIDSNNVFLVRVDSLGNAGPCSGINTGDVIIFSPSFSTSVISVPSLADVTLSTTTMTAGVTTFTPFTNTLCYYCYIPVPTTPSDPNCPNGISLYQKVYGGTKDEIGESLASSADSGYVMAGQTNSFGNGLTDGWISKVDKKGATVWSKAIGGTGNDYFYGIKRTTDNGFIAVGQTKSYGNAAGDAWLVKLDAGGTVQWSRKYGNGNANGEAGFDVVQLSDGGYALSGAHQYAAGVTESFVIRTDNLGNVIWSKQYGHSASDEAWGLTEDGNALLVVGFHTTGSFYDGYLMKLDKTTGVVQWIRRYDAENRSTFFAKIRVTSTGYQVFSLITDGFDDVNQQLGVWNINADGTVQNVRKMVIPGIKTINYGWHPYADGGFMIVTGESNSGSDMVFTRVNSTGGMIWSKKYIINGKQWIRAAVASPEGGYAAVGINNSAGETIDSNNVLLVRIDSLGNAGPCSGVNTNDVTVVSPSFTTAVISVPSLADVTLNTSAMTAGVANFTPFTNTICFYCLPKPTGTQRSSGGTGRIQHELKVYPNPVPGGIINLSIEAQYGDKAVISLVDLSGNVIAILAVKEIQNGNNLFSLQLPRQLQTYASYFIQVRFTDYTSSTKILLVQH